MKKITRIVECLVIACMMLFGLESCTPKDTIKAALEELNAEYQANPEEIDEGMVIDGISMNDKDVVYHVSVDEDYYDMSIIESNKDEIRESIVDEWRNSLHEDADVRRFLRLVAVSNLGVIFQYEGNGGSSPVNIEIPSYTVKQIVK